jgi:hypothetical protein
MGMVLWDGFAVGAAKDFFDVTCDMMLVNQDCPYDRQTLGEHDCGYKSHTDITSGSIRIASLDNLGPTRRDLFELVHRSAFGIRLANPAGRCWSALEVLMLVWGRGTQQINVWARVCSGPHSRSPA